MTGPTSAPNGLLAGVDVGGSKIAVVLATSDLELVARHTIQTGVGDADYAVNRIAEAVDATLAAAGRTIDDLAAIGVGVPGRVDPVGVHPTADGQVVEQRRGAGVVGFTFRGPGDVDR